MIIAALILLSSAASVLRTGTVKAQTGYEIMYASPSTKSITGAVPGPLPIQKYNFSIMVANLSQVLTITASIKSADVSKANVTKWYKGAGFDSLGFSIFTAGSYDPSTGDLQDLTAGSLSPIDITTPVELFKVEVTINNFTAGGVLIDIYNQYAGDIDNNYLLSGDCPYDHMINMNAITTNQIIVGSTVYNVTTLSNSTVPTMNIDTYAKSLNLTTSGTDGTTGYVNVTIPKTLLDCPEGLTYWHVLMDDADLTGSAIITQNSTHTFVYLAYSQSAHDIHITGTYVVPEYPSIAIVVTLLAMMTVAFALVRKVHKKQWQTL